MWGFTLRSCQPWESPTLSTINRALRRRWGRRRGDGLLSLQHSQFRRKLKGPLCYSTYERNVTWGRGSRHLLSAALVLLL